MQIAQEVEATVDYEVYADNLIRLAEEYDNCTKEIEKYNRALANGEGVEEAEDAVLALARRLGHGGVDGVAQRGGHHVVLVVVGVHPQSHAELLEVGGAGDESRLLAGLGEGGEKHGGEDGDDGDDDEELDEREGAAATV